MSPEKKLNSHSLATNGISYIDDIGDVETYLIQRFPYASIVREGLLEFEHIIPNSCFEKLSDGARRLIDKEYRSSKIPGISRAVTSDLSFHSDQYQIAYHEKRFKLAMEMSRIAKGTNAKELHWQELVQKLFEISIDDTRRVKGGEELRPKEFIGKVRVETQDTWLNGKKALQRTTDPVGRLLTAPKPDLYIALPIFHRIPNPTGFYRDDYVQNFTETQLSILEQEKWGNLISNPIASLDTGKKIKTKHHVCFPSAVVEIKHQDVGPAETEKCYSQAANGAAVALSMLGRLVHFSGPIDNVKEIRPVVTFTFVGPIMKVWLAYISEKKMINGTYRCRYEMRCIWKGTLRSTWNTLQLLQIIENTYQWTVNSFRPWVSNCIDKWRFAESGGKVGKLSDLTSDSEESDSILAGDSNEESEWEKDEEDEEVDEETDEENNSETDGSEIAQMEVKFSRLGKKWIKK